VVFHNDAACREGAVEFAVQIVVAEADGGGLGPAVGEDDALDARPVGGREAHRAGFAGSVKRGFWQVEAVDRGTRGTDRHDFRVRRRVAAYHDLVPAFANDLFVADDDGTERAALAEFAAFSRQFDGAGEKLIVGVHSAAGAGLAVEAAQFDARCRLPARLAVFGDDIGENSATDIELRGQAHEARGGGGDQVVENSVGDGLVEGTLVAVRPDVELEALQFDAEMVGDVIEKQRREIGLAGLWAQAGEFGNLHVDVEIAVDRGIREGFEGFRRLAGHAWIHRNGVDVIIRPPSRWAIPEPADTPCA